MSQYRKFNTPYDRDMAWIKYKRERKAEREADKANTIAWAVFIIALFIVFLFG